MVIENPWNVSQATYLQHNFLPPTVIDKNRALRGDYYAKPTAYWFVNRKPTYGQTLCKNPKPKIVYKEHGEKQITGVCDEIRSLISPVYAHAFICDFILGKISERSERLLFNLND